jgi:epoxyqueuosine reductase QueG
MSQALVQAIGEHLGTQLHTLGIAPVDRFADAPDRHHPANACKNAASVVVMGIALPRGILSSPDYDLHFLQRSYISVYKKLDDLALGLSRFIEDQSGAPAVPIPSYAPLVYEGMEPWGIISLKHAAQKAGLGAFGKNHLLHHPQYGAMLRLGAVVTSAELPGSEVIQDHPCPEKCMACMESCPVQAFSDEGSFDKMKCLLATIKHAIYPLALKEPGAMEHIERIVNTAGYNYWLKCNKCLKVCPNNQGKLRQSA